MTNVTDAKVEQVQRWSAEVQHGTLGSATRHYSDPHGSWVHHDDYATLQAEVAQLQAALAEARRDAERYRWLRDPQPPSARWSDAIDALLEGRAADADAAIDAAMGSANGQG